jgi:hypothetical protein
MFLHCIMDGITVTPGERECMSEKHRTMYENFRKIKSENRKRIGDLYESRKAEFDAMADKLGPADNVISEIKVGTEADLSGVPADRIINIKLDFSSDNMKKMLSTGELKKGVEWTMEDAAAYNPLCLCGCGRRGPLPAPGEWVPEGWRPTEEDRLYCCTDSVTPHGVLENRHAGHQIQTDPKCNLTVSDK